MMCKHKPKMLKCRACEQMFCSGCIQLEVHSCPKLNAQTQAEKDILEKKMVKVVAPKVTYF